MPTAYEVRVDGSVESPDKISGKLTNNTPISSTLDNELDINGGETLAIQIDGSMEELAIQGAISNPTILRSVIQNRLNIMGKGSLPIVLDRTAIHYATTANWNAEPELIGEEGHIYIYSDHIQKEDSQGNPYYVPGIKVGDGITRLIDTAFIISGDDEDFYDHINNHAIHVSDYDRTTWDGKVSATVNVPNEELILMF